MRLAALIISCAVPATAQDFLLDLPINCTPGDNCYIQNYVDHDPSDRAQDYRCGHLTYDTHKGTDFALPSRAAMEAGVDVLAAAAGTVQAVRSDMADAYFTPERAAEIGPRECGNGVVLLHGDGWETQYCHMKQGSVTVAPGDEVAAGDVIGQVGLSGRTQFPHVHLSVRKNGEVVDPFDSDGEILCSTPADETLWREVPDTAQGGVIAVGFADHVPDFDAVKAGTAAAETLVADAPIVFWGLAFGAEPGDVIGIRIDGPEGPTFETQDVLDRRQALVMRAGGLRAPDRGWAAGEYLGTFRHSRDGEELSLRIARITLR
ncbi:M23 family metallopeptidase [Thalassorhabdomicrobium marinisediminis]|uniref:M23 family metallopeptidase n=1 Tax=Thalassorhabdomicrobium marinisediminis TaxID=2170577 RepID=UPI002492DC60|nr:M23 family metallopeptidase [Thalassorhabdomicrobium marinisediminis]